MKFKLLLLPALLAPALQAEPFISEYVEGSSNNKALEIYNPSSSPLNLAGYSIKVFSNGAVTAGKTVNLSGEIAAKSVLVLVDTAAVQELKDKQTSASLTLGSGNFNGDDAVALYNGTTLVDVVGQIGFRPASSWGTGDIKTIDKTLVRQSTVTQGDNDGSDAFDPAAQWVSFAVNTFSNLGSHSMEGGGGTDPDPDPTPDPLIGACGETATFISAIQGSGTASAEVGKIHIIEGIVTQQLQTATGFYVQEEAADSDNNPATSEAIFIYNNGVTDYPAAGSKVRIIGVVEEFFTKTQLKRSAALLDCGPGEAIAPVALSLPFSNLTGLEALESMQVQIGQSLTVSDTFSLGTYGELGLSSKRLYTPTNQFRPGTAEAIALAAQNKLDKIILDDLQNGKNPANISYPAPGLTMNNPVRLGDTFSNLQGVLDFSFSAWRLLPAVTPTHTASNLRQDAPELKRQDSLTVASFNVLNYFNGNGDGTGFPTSRGANSTVEFERQADKIVAALAAMDADVVGLMEIENDGYGSASAIVDLVSRLNAVAGAGTYSFASVPGSTALGTDEISVGLIYKAASVVPVGNAVTTSSGVFGFGNRQPLVQTFKEVKTNEVFSVAVNHFKSKGSCPGSTSPDRDFKDGQSCWNATRVQAATQLMAFLNTAPTGSTDPDVLVIGDLNAYAKEDPIHTFVSAGFVNLIEKHQGNRGYGYSFSGESGYLDHALASSSLSSQVSYATEWHINSDEPIVFDYNVEDKTSQQQSDLYQDTPFRSSDHDPVVVELALSTAKPADLDKDGDVDNNDINLFNQLLRSGAVLSLSYDFNKDGKVNSTDARAMAALCTYARCAIK
ncbi:ExeM/NucH family extracellular endonuclease [Rheinheimera riviphila]|uniref:ExeM/NucH family extracellular endonuclease n=1 Tax=Rheinheimera riviphila TaxID=1834037 RepID=A0A437QG09_9GAMM|nr:ExeM/NucH family extracellular endonuclease [Rheinheimera riviphila]RVU33488.1 ExeM/NucH family extracellular endonuclease [Rheinheimera riviphila]